MTDDLNMQLFERVMRLPQVLRVRMFMDRGPAGTLERRMEDGDRGPWEPMPRRAGPGGRRGPDRPFSRGPEDPDGPERIGPDDLRERFRRGPCGRPGPGEDFEGGPGMRGPGRPGQAPLSRERALELLLENENGLRQKEISEKLRINPSSTSEFIDLLQQSGYIQRAVDPDDRRATRIVLTELGRARALDLQDERNERFDRLFGRLNDMEKRQLIALIDKLLGAPEGRKALPEIYRT